MIISMDTKSNVVEHYTDSNAILYQFFTLEDVQMYCTTLLQYKLAQTGLCMTLGCNDLLW